MARSDILERESEIRQWITEKQSKAFICKQLQCKSTTLNSYLEKMNIQYDGRKDWAKGKKLDTHYKPAAEYAKQDNVKGWILK